MFVAAAMSDLMIIGLLWEIVVKQDYDWFPFFLLFIAIGLAIASAVGGAIIWAFPLYKRR
jgi:hypothetical protein